MRNFNDADRKKKSARISLPDNPGNLSEEALNHLEDAVKTAAKDGYVACPTGWKLAKDGGVSRLDVGAMIDKLGVRVTDCQLGCFKVEKSAYTGTTTEPLDEEVSRRVKALGEEGELTCSNVFALARELKVKPLSVANAANVQGYKLRQCQLGCF
jgi:hypothetical protein